MTVECKGKRELDCKTDVLSRDDQRGLWVDAHPVPPWEWRARQKRYR